MVADTDPGEGVGIVIGAGAPPAGSSIASELCVSYDRSLDVLMLDNKAGAYGMILSGQCKVRWKVWQRDGWLDRLFKAEHHIRRELGMALCPMEICEELHDVTDSIKLNQAPIAYLGQKTYGEWTEAGIVYDGDTASLTLCESDYGVGVEPGQIQFSYPDSVLTDYSGPQALQSPTRAEDLTCAPEDGYLFTWQNYQLVKPDVDATQISDSDNFIQNVKWRVWTVETTSAGSLVGMCDCDCCVSGETLTLSIADANEGLICVDNCGEGPIQTCFCRNRRIKVNYATAFSCDVGLDPTIEEAIVLLALVKAGRTPIKPCGCDNSWIDYMLEDDPSSRTEFALKLRFGTTRAGMEVQRLLGSIERRPSFNDVGVQVGGLLTSKKIKRNRTRSILRG